MKKNLAIGILAVATVVFAVLFLIANNDRGKLYDPSFSLAIRIKGVQNHGISVVFWC